MVTTFTLDPSTIDEAKREKVERIKRGQQIHAMIKRTSKYYGQGEKGALFPVYIKSGHPEDYLVQGGPGGQYRLKDVNLFIIDRDREVRIS